MSTLHSADELMAKTGCTTKRALRAWLRRHRIKMIDAPAGPLVPHEALLDALGLKREQTEPELYDPATTV